MTDTKHNGWTNWDTWEAYNILTSTETLYNDAKEDATQENLEMMLFHYTERFCDIEHLAFHAINWSELINAFKKE